MTPPSASCDAESSKAKNQPMFPGRLALQQRVLPNYRLAFFDALAERCQGGLSVFAGQPRPGEVIAWGGVLKKAAHWTARNWQLLAVDSPFFQLWQGGLVRWLENWQPDALIVEANPRYLSTPAAVEWMHARRRPALGWGLGAPPLSGLLGRLRAAGRARFLRSLDGLIAYSQRGADEYRRLGFPSGRIFVAPNATSPRPASLPLRPATWAGKPAVLFVGRLQARKRLDLLLRACASLPASLQPRLWIVGDGPARLELQALASQLYPAAEFLGARFGAELQDVFHAADLFALPGTGGLAVQQALAAGLPVIVAEGDGTQDDLVRPENGWRVAPGDAASLAAALQQALADPARLRRMGVASYQIARDEANLENMVSVFIRALLAITGEKS